MQVMPHATIIPGFHSMEELADRVENLRYDALLEFVEALRAALTRRANEDARSERPRLAAALRRTSESLVPTSHHLEEVWRICRDKK